MSETNKDTSEACNCWREDHILPHNDVPTHVGQEEWVAEAYMKTDYSNINENDFVNSIKKYTAFKIQNSDLFEDNGNATV